MTSFFTYNLSRRVDLSQILFQFLQHIVGVGGSGSIAGKIIMVTEYLLDKNHITLKKNRISACE
jgi:hypothetical protein